MDSKLKAGDFAAAATIIRGARKPTNKNWADQQDERILSGWRKAAGDAGTPQKQIESFDIDSESVSQRRDFQETEIFSGDRACECGRL